MEWAYSPPPTPPNPPVDFGVIFSQSTYQQLVWNPPVPPTDDSSVMEWTPSPQATPIIPAIEPRFIFQPTTQQTNCIPAASPTRPPPPPFTRTRPEPQTRQPSTSFSRPPPAPSIRRSTPAFVQPPPTRVNLPASHRVWIMVDDRFDERFKDQRVIGKGGFGEFGRATGSRDNREVVVKSFLR